MNIRRSPLCDRNLGYFSEDPFLAGVTGGAGVHGAQSQGVGISPKYIAANNQETDRLRVNAAVDMHTGPDIPSRAPRRVSWHARLGW